MKKLMLICAPVRSRSGYGAHARDLVWSFLQHDKYDIIYADEHHCCNEYIQKSRFRCERCVTHTNHIYIYIYIYIYIS